MRSLIPAVLLLAPVAPAEAPVRYGLAAKYPGYKCLAKTSLAARAARRASGVPDR